MPIGKRDSEWHVLRRCLAIIRRVQRGPANWEDLVQAVRHWEGNDAYGQLKGEALQNEIQRDLSRIRKRLWINIRYNRRAQSYQIEPKGTDHPLLDLPDEDLAILNWLEQSFAANTPRHQEVSRFLRRLRGFLSDERLSDLERQRTLLHLDLSQRDEGHVPLELLIRLSRAVDRQQVVEFEYDSIECEPGFLERHRVKLYDLPYFDPERGHYYLRAWCEHLDYKDRRDHVRNYRYYRLDRMKTVEILPTRFFEPPPKGDEFKVEYRLSQAIARHEVNYNSAITIESVETEVSGAKIVRGTTHSLFWATRFLLHYGEACTVLGGPELRREMERIVKEMAQNYGFVE